MERKNLVRLVRDPDERRDIEVEGIPVKLLTRERLLEIFPGTKERYIHEGALLVRHPYLHPKFAKVLLPASNLYTVLWEEAGRELSTALIRLGATAVELEQTTDEGEHSRKTRSGKGSLPGFNGDGYFEKKDSNKDSVYNKTTIILSPQREEDKVNIERLDEREFFDQLVFYKDNITLKALFNELKAGRVIKEFRLEFKHTIKRFHALEHDISIAFFIFFHAKLNFQQEYEKNRIEWSSMVAKFE